MNNDTPSLLYHEIIILGYKQKKHLSNERCSLVGIPGLEPGMTGPESVVLPLHHIPILLLRKDV